MDERLKKLDEFNGQIIEFDGTVKVLEGWLPEGRKRMDELLDPNNPIAAEERVVQTMELQVYAITFSSESKRNAISEQSEALH
jgi:hypothetical protein